MRVAHAHVVALSPVAKGNVGVMLASTSACNSETMVVKKKNTQTYAPTEHEQTGEYRRLLEFHGISVSLAKMRANAEIAECKTMYILHYHLDNNKYSMNTIAHRITLDPDLCNGKPTIRGKRITVQTVLEFLSAGDSADDILAQFPSLEPDDISACLHFASEVMNRTYTLYPQPRSSAA